MLNMESTSAANSVVPDQNNSNPQEKEVAPEVENSLQDRKPAEDSVAFSPVTLEDSVGSQAMEMLQNHTEEICAAENMEDHAKKITQSLPNSELAEGPYCPENFIQNLKLTEENQATSECNMTAVLEKSSKECAKEDEASGSVEPAEDWSCLPEANKQTEEDASNETLTASTSLASPHKLPPSPSCPGTDADAATAAPVSDSPFCSSAKGNEATKSRETASSSQGDSVYYIKWITFDNAKVPIITQNENGPCPLLAIMNVLLLKGKVKLAPMLEMVTSEQLMAYLGDCVIENMPQNLPEIDRANYEQNMQDAMAVMYKLQTGLDVNVRFTGVSDFEYTPECIIFDLLEIGLYHGWLVDPQDQQAVRAVGKCSYNQLVEKIIHQKSSDNEDDVREALLAEQFLERTASQLTYHGLCELSSTVKENELCIFFRNNHFSTLYCHDKELFLLVTDQGFLTESNVVWETLSNVDGDCHFVDASFRVYTKPDLAVEAIPEVNPYTSGDRQIDSDYQVALSLQQDQQLFVEQDAAWASFRPDMQNADHELAVRLQEEEDRRAAAAVSEEQAFGYGTPQQPNRDRRPREREDQRERRENKSCVLL